MFYPNLWIFMGVITMGTRNHLSCTKLSWVHNDDSVMTRQDLCGKWWAVASNVRRLSGEFSCPQFRHGWEIHGNPLGMAFWWEFASEFESVNLVDVRWPYFTPWMTPAVVCANLRWIDINSGQNLMNFQSKLIWANFLPGWNGKPMGFSWPTSSRGSSNAGSVIPSRASAVVRASGN
jgi:hypothetical protein